jgi:hypothetical protein
VKIEAKQVLVWPVFAIFLMGIATSLIHLGGALFFLDTSSVWDFLGPASLLTLLIVVLLGRSLFHVMAAYLLAVTFVLSYVFDRWRWVVDRYNEEGLYFFPDAMECLFLVVLLIVLHTSRSR